MQKHRRIRFDSTSCIRLCGSKEDGPRGEGFLCGCWESRLKETSFSSWLPRRHQNITGTSCIAFQEAAGSTQDGSPGATQSPRDTAAVLVCVSICYDVHRSGKIQWCSSLTRWLNLKDGPFFGLLCEPEMFTPVFNMAPGDVWFQFLLR